MSVSEVFNIDNMIYMATIPDKFFDLVRTWQPQKDNRIKYCHKRKDRFH